MVFAIWSLVVFAAASLHGAFNDIGATFERAHPGVVVRFDFDGSQILFSQLAGGAHADVFASADQRWMQRALAQHLVTSPAPFAGNTLVALASTGSSVRVLADLGKPGVRVDVCAESVPCGRYARAALAALGMNRAVAANVVSNELNVEAVVTKVELGDADAGIVYASDARAAKKVRVISIPARAQPHISYPIAAVAGSERPDVARAFIVLVRSARGQAILRRHGFVASP